MTFRSEIDQAVRCAREALQAHPLDLRPLRGAAHGLGEIRAKTSRSPEQERALRAAESRLQQYRASQRLVAGEAYDPDPVAASELAAAIEVLEGAFATYTLAEEWRHVYGE